MTKYQLILYFLILTILSCEKTHLFSEYKSINKVWDTGKPVLFDFNVLDTLNTFNFFIKLRTDDNYMFNNIYLDISLDFPSGERYRDTLEYAMSNPDGSMLGRGMMTVKEHKLWYKGYKKSFKFNEVGNHKLTVKHLNRELGKVNGVKFLKGVLDVGYSVETVNEK